MHIALLSPLFESVPPKLYGGTERVIYNLCNGLKALHVDTTIFASADSSIDSKIIPVVDQAFRLRTEPVHDLYSYNMRMLALVAKHADEFNVIHNHHDYWMLPLSEMVKTPLITTLHGRLDIPDAPAAISSFPKSKFVSISNSQREPLKNIPWLSTIYHGIDVDNFVFQPKPGKYLAFLGRVSPEKKPEWAIYIAKKAGIPLKIAAKIEPGLGTEYYDEFVKPHVDGKFIEYVGEISENEKSEFLGNALAMLFPIDWPEPFGLVTIEALACGTPVLTRPVGSMPELMSDGITGFMDLDIDRLADLVPAVSKLDRAKCRAWVEEGFSLKRMAKDYLDAYVKITERY